ncbi:MAG: beta strand repeat-containing protein, partial [Nevskiales bacterium]
MTVTAAVVTAVQVTPTNPSIAKGTTQQFTATAVFSDATTQNVTNDVGTVWASSNTGVATISNTAGSRGLATSLTEGSTTISAAFMGMSGNTTLTVTPAVISRIDVTPMNPSVPKGTTQSFTATAVFTDSTSQNVTDSATWSSSNDTIATVSNAAGSKGLAAANAVGSATISALFDGVIGSTTMTVTPASITSISVTPTNPSLPDGFNLQFAATGTLSDGTTRDVTTEVTWLTTNSAVATVSNAAGNEGLATAVDPGFTTVVAQSGSVQGSTGLTVTSATLSSIGVTPNPVSVAKGLARQFTATGTFSDMSTMDLTRQVTWSSSATGVATISNAADSEGLAQTVDTGSTTITATRGAVSGNAALTVTDAEVLSIEISPNPETVAKGLQTNLTATGTFTDGSTMDITEQATWASSDNAVATVSNVALSKGRVTGLSEGTVTISATLNGVTGNGSLTVTAAVLQSIDVTPDAPSVPLGLQQQFTAMGSYSDGSTLNITNSVTWASTNSGVASISNAAGSEGLASTLSEGTT